MKLFSGSFDGFQIGSRVVPETKLERMPHNRFPDLFAMGGKLIADRRPDEVGSVGIKALLHQKIDMVEVDVTWLIAIFSVSFARSRSLRTAAAVHLLGGISEQPHFRARSPTSAL